jgi:two-component system, sensor histidine kinase RegB
MRPRFREFDEAHSERVLLNLSWLIKLRWAAVAGQLLAIVVAWQIFEVRLPVGPLLLVIGTAAVTNLMLQLWFGSQMTKLGLRGPDSSVIGRLSAIIGAAQAGALQQNLEQHDKAESSLAKSVVGRWGETLILGLMVLDMLLLTSLLYFSGGPSNPFVIFYLVNILLVAVLVRPLWSAILTILAFLCYGLLFIDHRPLPVLELSARGERSGLHLGAILAAFATAAVTLLYFYLRVTLELDRFEKALARSRQAQERSAKLTAMATLAAGAAHELSSPLSTIAIVSKELLNSLEAHAASEEECEDVRLIRREVQRCRSILDQMAHDAGESTGEAFQSFGVRELVAVIMDGLRNSDRVHVHLHAEILSEALHLPLTAVAQALRGLLKNALDASVGSKGVLLELSRADGQLLLLVRDEGRGMSPEVLEQAENPFFTTKEAGQGMGLGLLLTRNVLERLGGSMELTSEVGVGTSARITLPLADTGMQG